MDIGEDNLALRVASFSYYLNSGHHEENFVQKIGTPPHAEDPIPPIHATISKEISFPISSGIAIPSHLTKPLLSPSSYAFNFSHSIHESPDNKLKDHQYRPRVANSFSSHLNDAAQDNFLFKIKGNIHEDPKNDSLLPRTFPTHLERLKSTNGEIGIFGADKYFNMKMEYGTKRAPMNHDHHDQKLPSAELKPHLRSATPSIYSDASSGNSRSALLHNFPERNSSLSQSQTKPKRALGRRIFASFGFGCSGPCLDKRAVYITENNRRSEDPNSGSKRGDNTNHFAFPILNSHDHQMQITLPVKKQFDDENLEADLRKSLDVFGSDHTLMKKGSSDISIISMNLERKLSMLTWDAIPKASSLPTTTIGSTTICDDLASDASSDLFEIENISGSPGSCPILSIPAPQAADHEYDISAAAGCMTPTTEYAPSEASIEWSVITASAAEFSSVISDYDEKNIGISGEITNNNSRYRNLSRKEAPKTRPSGLLLGCKSQKAASVVETVHKSSRVERY